MTHLLFADIPHPPHNDDFGPPFGTIADTTETLDSSIAIITSKSLPHAFTVQNRITHGGFTTATDSAVTVYL